ncbi:MAG: DUF3313 domain-containing protein [Acidobacteriota bacterium]
MTTKHCMLLGFAALLLLLPTAGWSDHHEIPESGFLDDYSQLEPMPGREGAHTYTAPGFDPKEYGKFIFESIEIWIDPESEYKGIQPDKLKAVTDAFYKEIVKALGDDYPVVEKPGPGVIVARIALTNVKVIKKRLFKPYSILPVGAITTGAKKAAGQDIRLEQAFLEAEMLDSESGKRLRATLDTRAGEKLRKKIEKEKEGPETSWSDIKKTLAFYAAGFKETLDAARGVAKH